MSAASIHRLVDTITGMLLQLPAPQRLEVLRQVEARVKPAASEGEMIRKVSRYGRIYVISIRSALPEGNYRIGITDYKAIYEPSPDAGDVKVRRDRRNALRVPIPKWVYEALGEPLFVRVRVEGSRIIVEPA